MSELNEHWALEALRKRVRLGTTLQPLPLASIDWVLGEYDALTARLAEVEKALGDLLATAVQMHNNLTFDPRTAEASKVIWGREIQSAKQALSGENK
jgi:hypothetical protein